ncbi:hsp90 co-chaperone Cdc37 [Numenius arquata]|uniref:hsp90 co-chaperone Cdc37 n=1 Tax=Numenius arquata TaxID=31919 RepID=UPI003D3073B7
MVDYSVWDHIEVSDDEDETHPNIDTASLFRWRHQARVERMEQFQKEKEELDKGCRECKRKLAECQRKLKELEVADPEGSGKGGGMGGELEKLRTEAQQLRKEEKNWEKKLEELKKKREEHALERRHPQQRRVQQECLQRQSGGEGGDGGAEREKTQNFRGEIREADQTLWDAAALDDSQKYLSDNPHLVCEETANYLVIWCIDLEVKRNTP